MDKIIVYGLGKEFFNQRLFIEAMYDVIGYSDKRRIDIGKYIEPENICNCQYSYVYITSYNFYEEIKKELVSKYEIDESKIISMQNVCGGGGGIIQ